MPVNLRVPSVVEQSHGSRVFRHHSTASQSDHSITQHSYQTTCRVPLRRAREQAEARARPVHGRPRARMPIGQHAHGHAPQHAAAADCPPVDQTAQLRERQLQLQAPGGSERAVLQAPVSGSWCARQQAARTASFASHSLIAPVLSRSWRPSSHHGCTQCPYERGFRGGGTGSPAAQDPAQRAPRSA